VGNPPPPKEKEFVAIGIGKIIKLKHILD